MLCPLVKAIKLGSVYVLPAQDRHHQDAQRLNPFPGFSMHSSLHMSMGGRC